MHNSQDGAAVVYELKDSMDGYRTISTPNNYLLISDCAGCHSSATSDTIVDGTGSADGGTPIVFNTGVFNNPLAGGNFSYILGVDADADSYGHNVSGIKVSDGTLGLTPPGGSPMSSPLTCAGQFGCHGDRSVGKGNYSGTKGAHHTDDTGGITGASIGLSYRFLNGIVGTENGILGNEDPDWEQTTNTNHNQYKGSNNVDDTGTISAFCAQCHGNFHGNSGIGGTASPWKRHPTDIVLPNTGEFLSISTSYNAIVPFGQQTLRAITDMTVAPSSDTVMCLSCHRAHASPYYKILRWNIKGPNLLSVTPNPATDALYGCVVCHTSKD